MGGSGIESPRAPRMPEKKVKIQEFKQRIVSVKDFCLKWFGFWRIGWHLPLPTRIPFRVRRRLDILTIQFFLAFVFFAVYSLVRGIGIWAYSDAHSTAMRHLGYVVDFEEAIGIYNEMQVANATVDNTSMAWLYFISYFYVTSHFLVTPVYYVWVGLCRPKQFPFFMTGFWITSLLAAVVYASFPLAPPKVLPGFPNVLGMAGLDPQGEDSAVKGLANAYAAMPSLHFGWSFIVGTSLIALHRHRRWFWQPLVFLFGLGYPSFMLYVIVSTSNHFWADAMGALLLISIAYGFTLLGYRRWHWQDYEEKLFFWNVTVKPPEQKPDVNSDIDNGSLAHDPQEQLAEA